MSELKYCQGVKCHTYKTKDRIRGTKGNTSVFSTGNIAAGGGIVQEIAPNGTIVWE